MKTTKCFRGGLVSAVEQGGHKFDMVCVNIFFPKGLLDWGCSLFFFANYLLIFEGGELLK
jgi:hypothetical protein